MKRLVVEWEDGQPYVFTIDPEIETDDVNNIINALFEFNTGISAL